MVDQLTKIGRRFAPFHLRGDLNLSDLADKAVALATITNGSRLAEFAVEVYDINAATKTGAYSFQDNATHVPFAEDGLLSVIALDVSNVYQLARSIVSEKASERRRIGGTWGAWNDATFATAVGSINDQIVVINNNVADLDTRIDGHDTHLTTVDSHLGTIDTHLGASDTRLNGHDTHFSSVDSLITGLGNTKADKVEVPGYTEVILTANTTITLAAHNNKIVVLNSALSRALTLDTPVNLTAAFKAYFTNMGVGVLTLAGTFDDASTSIILQTGQSAFVSCNGSTVHVLVRPEGLSGRETVVTSATSSLTKNSSGRTMVFDSAVPISVTLSTPANLGDHFIALITNANVGDLTVIGTFDDGSTSIILQKSQSIVVASNGTTHRLLLRGAGAGLSGDDLVVTGATTILRASSGKTVAFNSASPIAVSLDTPTNLGARWMGILTNINTGDVTLTGVFDDGTTTLILRQGQSVLINGNGSVHRMLLRSRGAGITGEELVLTGAATVLRASTGKTVVLNSATAMTVTLDTPTNLGAKWFGLFTNINTGDVTLSGTFDDGNTGYLLRKGDSLLIAGNGTVHRIVLKDQASVTVVEEFAPVVDVAYIDLANTPLNAAAVTLVKGGLPQPPSAWTLTSPNRLTLTGGALFRGATGEKSHVRITKSSPVGTLVTPSYSSMLGNGTVGPYTLPAVPQVFNALSVRVGSIPQPKDTAYYTVAGNQITFADVVASTSLLEFEIINSAILGVTTPAADSVTAIALQAADVPAMRTKLNAVNKSGDTITGPLAVVNATGTDPLVVQGNSTSALIKLQRTTTSAGVGYIGADIGNAFRVFDSALGDVLTIDQSGRVQMPKQPSFMVRSAFSGNLGPGPSIDYVFTNVQHNIGSCYNVSNGRFTAPVTGIYTLGAQILSRSTGGTQISLRINGADYLYSENDRTVGGTGYLTSTLHAERLQLTAGDYVTVYIGTPGAAYGGAYDFFSGGLVG